jgi:hypothetical protein
MPNVENNRWFIGEQTFGGLCNQLFGIYSYVPTARLLNASLIVGDMYSRTDFENTYEITYKSQEILPFSYFFDWDYFKNYWVARGLSVIEYHEVADCLNSTSKILKFKREAFYARSDQDIYGMLENSGISVPIPEVEEEQVFTVDFKWKMVAFYNNWQSNKHLKRLIEMHNSLILNSTINHVVNIILANLPEVFWSVHMRLEGI